MHQTNSKLVNENLQLFKAVPDIIDIAKPLSEQTKVRFLLYSRFYDNGCFFELATTYDWCKHYFEKHMDKENIVITSRLQPGLNHWKCKTGALLTGIQEDARDNFNIDARLDVVYRDEFNKCFHQYSFYADKKNADFVYSYYDMHRIKILKFVSYFNHKAVNLMIEGNTSENLVQVSDYVNISKKISNAKRSYVADFQESGETVNLTDREFEIMVLYAGGATAKQIANMLNKSPKTIEKHLDNLRKKTGHANRFLMHKYIIDNGWEDIIRFFFPYVYPKLA